MLLVLVLIGLNMRPLLTSVGPLLPQLRQASGMSFSVAALLTALPVVTMGGLALAGNWLHQHVSERRSVAISLLLIAVGALMRELYPQSALLLSSALLGGVGIGIIQAVMPSVINGGYASLIAWLPAFYIEIGASAQYSGSLLALMTLGQAAGALLMPAMARHQDRRKLLMLALVLQLVGFCGFIWLPMQLPVLWAMVCGLGLGGAFPLCLLLALDHSVQPAIAGKLVAFMQGIGFIIAGLAPWFSGVLRSISGNYLMDWAFHALCVVGLMIITLRFAPVRFPQLWVKEA
ncbi:cyanate transporter [Escherichia coli]|nr:cyanate transporter [Escherichia coli]ELM5126265.1 cyanate transporter [Escherichia coli]